MLLGKFHSLPKILYNGSANYRYMIIKGRVQEREHNLVKLDVKDKKIISLLSNNSRMPLSEVAKKVMLSRDSISYRIKRLQENKVVLRLFPLINYKHFGYNIFHVFIIADETNKKEHDGLISDLYNHPNIISLMEYNDRWDFHISLIAKNIRDYDRIMTEITTKYKNVIVEKDISEVIRTYKMSFTPYDSNLKINPNIFEHKGKTDLDEHDMDILKILTQDARQSTYEIGQKIGLNPDTVGYRIKKMIANGPLMNFTALNNFTAMGYHWYTFVVQMKTFDHKHELKFQAFIKDNPHIIRAVKTLGVWDVMLYVIVNNITEFHMLMKDIKREFYDIIKHYESWNAYEEHFYNPIPSAIYNKN